ncbi:MAG: imidazole glycerol phosphate synthase subunit HisH [Firmicutes bacterium]|nr:imidazole glycerol phosphate synthase subunit HisH [Bacillota bacterium]
MIAIADYGVGNIFSLKSSLAYLGEEAVLTADPEVFRQADHLILPGVGAFGDAAEKLRQSGFAEVIREEAGRGKPLLGICLGMQLLLEKSFEYGEHVGLGLIPGEIVGIEGQLTDPELKVPQMGWNALQYPQERAKSRLYQGVAEGEFVYFVHSFCAVGSGDCLSAYVDYSFPVTASVEKENVYGVQYHPEKSGETGLKILKNFCTL